MGSKLGYALAGLFVIGLAAAAVVVGLWLSLGDFQEDYDTYYVYMGESVSGLYVDAPVRYRGVDVGRVREIQLDPDNVERVRLRLEIRSGTPIKTDTKAVLTMQGLTGIAFIDLHGGTQQAPVLKAEPGQKYPVIDSGPSLMARLDEGLDKVLRSVDQITTELDTLMSEDNRQGIANIIANLEAVTDTLAAEDSRKGIGNIIANTEAFTESLNKNRASLTSALDKANRLLEQGQVATEKLPRVVDRVNSTAEAIDKMANEFSRTAVSIRNTADKVQSTVEGNRRDIRQFTGQTLPEIDALVGDLRDLTTSLRRLSRRLEHDPSALIRGRRAPPPGPGEEE